jgi:DNA-directed RNA polymerase subunit RPC12/RpoP
MMMYVCQECGEEFKELKIHTIEEPSEYWGRPVVEQINIGVCPYCGSEDIKEVQICEICGRPTSDYFSHYCDDCQRDLGRKFDRIKEQYKIDQDQLEELIAEHFGW